MVFQYHIEKIKASFSVYILINGQLEKEENL